MRPICAFQMSDFVDERSTNNRLTIYETWNPESINVTRIMEPETINQRPIHVFYS